MNTEVVSVARNSVINATDCESPDDIEDTQKDLSDGPDVDVFSSFVVPLLAVQSSSYFFKKVP